MGTERCAATRDLTTTAERCPRRDACTRHRMFAAPGPGRGKDKPHHDAQRACDLLQAIREAA